ncbi:hypothetical protein Bca101_056035 [Brassica carinata]
MGNSVKFRLKLHIDEKRNKVVLAEAEQDFVDVLLSLLTLPVGNVARLLENHKTFPGVLQCYKNLNKSVADMGINHFETEACKTMLMDVRSSKDIHRRRLKMNMSYTYPTKFFVCPSFLKSDPHSHSTYSNFNSTRCRCGDLMTSQILVPEEEQVEEGIGNNEDGVFVNCRSSFIITDDLKVTSNSIAVLMKVLNDQGYAGFSDLKETLIDVGFEEVRTILGCLFTSEAALTCAFLRKTCMTRNIRMLSPPALKNVKVCSVEVYVRKLDREILYAECNGDFVDSLLSFLVHPLELACALSNDNTVLRCVGNLLRSPCRRAASVDIGDLERYHLSISKVELISILKASLVSSSALTKGLSNLLVKKPKEEA